MLFFVEMIQDRSMPAEQAQRGDLKEIVCESLRMVDAREGWNGGVPVGGRSLLFVAEAESAEALDRELQEIPLWNVVDRVQVTPLVSFAARLDRNLTSED